MQALRNARHIARFVLVWFALSIGVAIASPVIHPKAMDLVCSSTGSMQLVVVGDDDLETSYYRDDQIDLNELLREQFYLALPMKPLCREDCQGLCPVCGINRNTATCGCELSWEDPRLAPLKSLTTPRPN